MIKDELKNIKSEKKNLRDFGLVVGGGFLVVSAIFIWQGKIGWIYGIGIGLLLIILGLVFPKVLKPLQKIWMAFGIVMGQITSRIILFLVFVLAITPLSIIFKIFKKHLVEKSDHSLATYWNYRKKIGGAAAKESLEKQF